MAHDRRSFLRGVLGTIAAAAMPAVRIIAMPVGYMLGRTWFFPAGTYIIKEPLVVPKGVTLVARGVKFVWK